MVFIFGWMSFGLAMLCLANDIFAVVINSVVNENRKLSMIHFGTNIVSILLMLAVLGFAGLLIYSLDSVLVN